MDTLDILTNRSVMSILPIEMNFDNSIVATCCETFSARTALQPQEQPMPDTSQFDPQLKQPVQKQQSLLQACRLYAPQASGMISDCTAMP